MNEQAMQEFGQTILRHFDVVAESMQHKMDLVVEGQQGLAERMERLDGRMDGLEKRMDSLGTKLDSIGVKLDAIAAGPSA